MECILLRFPTNVIGFTEAKTNFVRFSLVSIVSRVGKAKNAVGLKNPLNL